MHYGDGSLTTVPNQSVKHASKHAKAQSILVTYRACQSVMSNAARTHCAVSSDMFCNIW